MAYHSVNFIIDSTTYNSWTTWKLIPSSRPLINPPPVKTRKLEVPGKNGDIDLTESLVGAPTYGNRTGTIEFIVGNTYFWNVTSADEWYTVYSSILNAIHGRAGKLILEDEPSYYYEGRFAVNSWKSDTNFSRVAIDYDLGPLKYPIDGGSWRL